MRAVSLPGVAVVLTIAACDADRRGGGPVHGEWQVVSFEQPGITALSPSDAEAWIGTVARFSDSLAVLGDDRCETPEYLPDTTTADRFLQDYRVAPSTLGLGDTILSTRVRCGGDWISPASRLYHRGADLLAVWDGTFFVLRRR